ncbi:MAG TPA: helix-turn-helix transcriptional regulator [Jiangellales bacterium]|nr:helix-turn-helix transcriptional regulator [Jiangellales bacterium]
MGEVRLDGTGLRALLDAVPPAREDPPDESDVLELLRSVTRLVECDLTFWHWFTLRPAYHTYAYVEDPSAVAYVPDPEPWLTHLPEHPVMCGEHGAVVSISDVLTQQQFHRTWLFNEVFRVDGLRHEIGVALPCGRDERSVVVLSRLRSDFSERDHAVLELLRPHLAATLRGWRRPAPVLTPRQAEVMAMVAEGLSDGQIARRLGLSESTVGKHLEHVYARTGAHSRIQAVRLWAPAPD